MNELKPINERREWLGDMIWRVGMWILGLSQFVAYGRGWSKGPWHDDPDE